MSGDQPTLSTDLVTHSPGPWKVYPTGHSAPGYDVCERIISDAWTGRSLRLDGLSDVDAHLIAAAPTMLAALKAAQKDLETVQREISGIAPEAISPALPLIRAAIAEAEGRS